MREFFFFFKVEGIHRVIYISEAIWLQKCKWVAKSDFDKKIQDAYLQYFLKSTKTRGA